MEILVGLVVLLLLLLLSHFFQRKWSSSRNNIPPGPVGWPLVGFAWSLGERACLTFMKLKLDSYPNIMHLYIGETRIVFLNSFEAIKEALVTKGDNFAGRQKNMLKVMMKDVGEGIAFSQGPFWKEHRRFALRTLREFGLGRNQSEQIVKSEVINLVQFIDRKIDQGVSEIKTLDLLLRSVSNVICTLTMGEQPGYEDHEFMDVVNKLREPISRPMFNAPDLMFPSLFQYVVVVAKIFPRTREIIDTMNTIFAYMDKKIASHERSFDISHEPQDYIDAFLLEKHKLDMAEGADHTFTAVELRQEMFELFLAGTDTTSNSLAWGLLLLAIHPEIQAKCHAEIDATIGRERIVTMRDKESLPYILAVMDEIQRFASIAPMGLFHRNFEADTIMGYNIPADTLIVPFVYGVHHDPRVWQKPDEFYPEHFLSRNNESGTLQHFSREELIPFLIGKRECLGESLAKVELLLFIVSLLQKYHVSLPDWEKRTAQELLLGSNGPIRSPVDHKLLFQKRI